MVAVVVLGLELARRQGTGTLRREKRREGRGRRRPGGNQLGRVRRADRDGPGPAIMGAGPAGLLTIERRSDGCLSVAIRARHEELVRIVRAYGERGIPGFSRDEHVDDLFAGERGAFRGRRPPWWIRLRRR